MSAGQSRHQSVIAERFSSNDWFEF